MSGANSNSTPLKTILVAGIVAGTMDIVAALTQFYIKTEKDPTIVLRYIASAVFGKEASTGGTSMALVGLFFHYVIAFGFVILFFLLCSKIAWLWKNKIISGLLYGIIVWIIMSQVVLPLSLIGRAPLDLEKAIVPILILMFCIGLPTSLIVSRYYERK
ncbi:MAG: hypothetical protein V4722_19420 [Bacteroidota bacterium]